MWLRNILIGFSLVPAPLLAFAQNTPPVAAINNVQDLVQLMCTIFGYMFYGLITLSTIMILVAAFNYATAGDDSEKVRKATKMITYVAIAIAVALLARAIPTIVANFLGAAGKIGSC